MREKKVERDKHNIDNETILDSLEEMQQCKKQSKEKVVNNTKRHIEEYALDLSADDKSCNKFRIVEDKEAILEKDRLQQTKEEERMYQLYCHDDEEKDNSSLDSGLDKYIEEDSERIEEICR